MAKSKVSLFIILLLKLLEGYGILGSVKAIRFAYPLQQLYWAINLYIPLKHGLVFKQLNVKMLHPSWTCMVMVEFSNRKLSTDWFSRKYNPILDSSLV